MGHWKRWIGVSWDMPRSIIAWSFIGGMFLRSNGPAVMISSLRLESTVTVTFGSGTGRMVSVAMVATRIEAHTNMHHSAKGSEDGRP